MNNTNIDIHTFLKFQYMGCFSSKVVKKQQKINNKINLEIEADAIKAKKAPKLLLLGKILYKNERALIN